MLDGRVALVTGSTSGIGRGVAVRLASLGARVMVHGRDADGARVTLEAMAAGGSGEGDWHAADLADPAAIAPLFDLIEAELGPVEVLVNNAAHSTIDTFVPAESGASAPAEPAPSAVPATGIAWPTSSCSVRHTC